MVFGTQLASGIAVGGLRNATGLGVHVLLLSLMISGSWSKEAKKGKKKVICWCSSQPGGIAAWQFYGCKNKANLWSGNNCHTFIVSAIFDDDNDDDDDDDDDDYDDVDDGFDGDDDDDTVDVDNDNDDDDVDDDDDDDYDDDDHVSDDDVNSDDEDNVGVDEDEDDDVDEDGL